MMFHYFSLRPVALLVAGTVAAMAAAAQTTSASEGVVEQTQQLQDEQAAKDLTAKAQAVKAQAAPEAGAATETTAKPVVIVRELAPVTVIERAQPPERTAADLARQAPRNLREAFDEVTGVDFRSSGVFGFLEDVEVRGMGGIGNANENAGASRVTMEVDGVELTQSFSSNDAGSRRMWFGREYFDPDDLKSAAVTKGPGSTGLAGNVALRTKDPNDYLLTGRDFGGDVRWGMGTVDNSRSVGAALAGRFSDTVSASVSMTRRSFHEIENKDGVALRGATRTAANPVDGWSRSVNAKVVIAPSAARRLTLAFQHFGLERQTDFQSVLTATTLSSGDMRRNQRNAFSVRFESAEPTVLWDFAEWQFAQQRTISKWAQNATTRQFGQLIRALGTTEFRSMSNSVKGDFEKVLNDGGWLRHELRYGVRLQRSKLDIDTETRNAMGVNVFAQPVEYLPMTQQTQARLHVLDRMVLGNSGWSITPSVNVHHIRTTHSADNAANISRLSTYSKTAMSGGLRTDWQITPVHTVSLVLTSGLRMPGLGETGYAYRRFSSSRQRSSKTNPALNPERSRGTELSWVARGDWGSSKLSFFQNQYSDLISQECEPTSATAQDCWHINSPGRTKIRGWEWDGALNLGELGIAPQGLVLRGGLAWLKGTNADGTPRVQIDPPQGWLALRYTGGDKSWNAEAKLRFAARKKPQYVPVSAAIDELPGWSMWDLTFEGRVMKNLLIRGGIYNVFDRKYHVWSRVRTVTSNLPSYTEPGRHFGLNVQYKF